MGRFFIFWVGGIVLLNDVKVFIVVLIRVFLVFDKDELIFLFIVINKLKRFYYIFYVFLLYMCIWLCILKTLIGLYSCFYLFWLEV